MSKKIQNTAKDEVHPEWTMGGNPGAIEVQEARGQQQLANSEQLPVQISPFPYGKMQLEAAGVVFGSPTPGDPLFCAATLPKGWRIKPTDHSMWSDLVDGDGCKVASIFYKAAFYDRDAFMNVEVAK